MMGRGWDKVCAAAPNNARAAWEAITQDLRTRTARQHPLKGSPATRTVNGRELEQWQYEVISGGRLWYVIAMIEGRTVWLTEAMQVTLKQRNSQARTSIAGHP